MNNKTKLRKEYADKIASYFSDIDLEYQDFIEGLKNNKKNISDLCDIEGRITDYAEYIAYKLGYNDTALFVKENLELCINAYGNAKGNKHKGKEPKIADLAFWGKYEQLKTFVNSAIPEAQKLLDEYWAEVSKLETNGTNKTK